MAQVIYMILQEHLTDRATIIANCPTASSLSVVSTDTRHLVCMGTETDYRKHCNSR
jgi:hypothetical protein